MIFDYYDGVLFNKSFLRSIKDWRISRRVFDSFADRAVIQFICIPLVLNHKSFLWIYVAILLREVVISGYLAGLFKRNILLYPQLMAKLACAMIGVTTIAYLTLTFYGYLFVAGCMLIMSCLAVKEYRDRLKRNLQIEIINQAGDGRVEIF
jgi:phosphatidylglycerophosphate synthase